MKQESGGNKKSYAGARVYHARAPPHACTHSTRACMHAHA